MMGSTVEFITSLCSAAAACGIGLVLVFRACTNPPYSSGRNRRSLIHLWNQAALSARVAISASVPAASGPPRVAKAFSVLDPIYGLPGFGGVFMPDKTIKAVK